MRTPVHRWASVKIFSNAKLSEGLSNNSNRPTRVNVKSKQAVEKGSECFERLSMNGK
jgi:hypothetical protein